MPIQRASFKSVRKDKKRHQRNLRITSELKGVHKKFTALIQAKQIKEAKEVLNTLIAHLARAASRGILHKNTASRKISRLTKSLKKLEAGK